MANYVLVESRDPFESRDVPYYYDLAAQLAADGQNVTLFLVQNAVLAARSTVPDNPLTAVAGNVTVIADEFSLRERGIGAGETIAAIDVAEIDKLVDLMLDEPGTKVMWH